MTSEFDELQELILEDARKVYSETTIDHFMNPRNVGDMDDADGFGRVTGSCGDTMEIWLKVRNGTIASATFMTDGCVAPALPQAAWLPSWLREGVLVKPEELASRMSWVL
jgi:hypothetical protein